MLSERMRKAKDNYIHAKPAISCERAHIWTESYKRTEGLSAALRRAIAFRDVCRDLPVKIFEGELIVGAIGEFRKCGILTPEFSWTWVDREMDHFSDRVQDPYEMTEAQRAFVRKEIFPYWKGKSLEEAFLRQIPEETARVAVDTGIVDNDSKWRQSVGEMTPDYQDFIFKHGLGGIRKMAEEKKAACSLTSAEGLAQSEFYETALLTVDALATLALRYAEEAEKLSAEETDAGRAAELSDIAHCCRKISAEPPETFLEAAQLFWFIQLGGVLSENPLALNPGRFDQYMLPYYEHDMAAGKTDEDILEIIECVWMKLSEWVWTISANTADFFAGYNQFQNLTVGGTLRDGSCGVNALSYLCLRATKELKTHQPGLSVRIAENTPKKFLDAVMDLVAEGTGFPAIHSDRCGYQMLRNIGYEAEDARDWSNCGCVVPHFRKTFQWTSAVNVNFAAALEYATNEGKSRMTGKAMGLLEKPAADFKNFEEVKDAFYRQFDALMDAAATATILAQKLHKEMIPRPYFSALSESCMEKGKDLVDGGAKYTIGPVITGIGLSVAANGLEAIRKLVFEEKVTTMAELAKALDANWEGYDELRAKAKQCEKYGNDAEAVDALALEIANHYYARTVGYTDFYGKPFNSAFMGISNYLPAGRVIGATPDGRLSGEPISEGVSPFAGTDTSTPLAAMKSAAKLNQDIHSGGTLLNLRLSHDLVATKRGQSNLGAVIRAFFSMGAFHVQFNTVSSETLRKAQADPDSYRDLLVRVAGYSTQFVNLSKAMQDAIIIRTAHESF